MGGGGRYELRNVWAFEKLCFYVCNIYNLVIWTHSGWVWSNIVVESGWANQYSCTVTIKNKIVIFSAIDNLMKGAAGQAVQNMNVIYGFKEGEGLKWKYF